MADRRQIEELEALLQESAPIDAFRQLNEISTGIAAVLSFLYEDGMKKTVTAGQISSYMNVSTARVAVLLKKMAAKGLIVKETGAEDARTTVVSLSETGREETEQMRADIDRKVGMLIDRVGMERMREFAGISKEIHEALRDADKERS